MNFEFTNEQKQFREEVHDFLVQEVPPERQEVFGVDTEEDYQFGRALARKLASRRWLAVGWPEEHGGGGQGPIEQAILNEEMGYRMAPRTGITRPGCCGSGIDFLWYSGAKGAVPAGHRQRRRGILSGLQRAQRRLRPCFPGAAGGKRWRRLRA